MKIKFVISPRRKCGMSNNFNPKLTKYWQKQYYDLFKNWQEGETMSGFIARQPNGLYCRFSTIVDCPTHWNMTKEDYLNNVTGTVRNKDEGELILRDHLQPFSEVVESFIPNNMSQKEFDELLIDDNTKFKTL